MARRGACNKALANNERQLLPSEAFIGMTPRSAGAMTKTFMLVVPFAG